ncbi:hypothetical protein RhiJN_12372 [Ceratobasidium sp. AG-Ba]|nr:hypothetical protein RhiJN_12372 [Ceratobasidium sp. AG-Ba]QRW12976.1 hypothetical protein RhiLY_11975 [Ceratobasidium sp. AG-Ba]
MDNMLERDSFPPGRNATSCYAPLPQVNTLEYPLQASNEYIRELSIACIQNAPPSVLILTERMCNLRRAFMDEIPGQYVKGYVFNNLFKVSRNVHKIENLVSQNQAQVASLLPNLICVVQSMTRFSRAPNPMMPELLYCTTLMGNVIPSYSETKNPDFDEYLRKLAIACNEFVCKGSQSAALEFAQNMNKLRSWMKVVVDLFQERAA